MADDFIHRQLPDWPSGVLWHFTTRRGGVSDGPRHSLTLARAAGLPDAELEENWRRALAPLGVGPDHLALVNQVHGDGVLHAHRPSGPLDTLGDADALISDRAGLAAAVRVADCVPILLTDGRWIAAVHAGWRGVAAGILPRTIRQLRERGAGTLHLVIGPHISQDAFQVGPEVVDGIAASGVDPSVFAVADEIVDGVQRHRVDLEAALRAQVASLPDIRVHSVARCTTDPDLFSYRHDGADTGRMAGVILRQP